MNAAYTSGWVTICALDDIPVRGSRILKTDGRCIALFRTADNEVFALDDRCPHKGGPLSQGIVHGNAVTCPLHNWVISLETGDVTGEESKVPTHKTRIEDGQIQIDMLPLTGASS